MGEKKKSGPGLKTERRKKKVADSQPRNVRDARNQKKRPDSGRTKRGRCVALKKREEGCRFYPTREMGGGKKRKSEERSGVHLKKNTRQCLGGQEIKRNGLRQHPPV